MRANEIITEKWSQKYKSSINCSHPKGFSQRAHCAGKKKHTESIEMEMVCEDCGMCQTHGNLNEIAKGAKDSNGFTKCWPGKHAEGTKKGKNGGQVRNCVPNESQGVAEGREQDYLSQVPNLTWKPVSRGVWNTIQDEGLDEEQDAPKHTDWIMASLTISPEDSQALQAFDSDAIEDFNRFDIHLKSRHPGLTDLIDYDNGTVTIVKPSQMQGVAEDFNTDSMGDAECPKCHQRDLSWEERTQHVSCRNCGAEFEESGKEIKPGVAEKLAEEFDLIESIIDDLAEHNGVDAEAIWEDLETLDDDELYVFATTTTIMETEAWQKANNRDKTDGMSRKAVKAYRREHPGSKLKTAVTTKPSKLKKGSKASKRRKSYCSRSRGQMKMHNISCAKTPDKAICKARRRWNC